jgi:transposase
MMGIKDRVFKSHKAISLEQLVPKTNFYRVLEAKVDLAFVRELVRELYSGRGRSSIDPVVFFKLQLVMFFESIRSERQLLATAPMRLDVRWYLGYDLDEALPNHSSLSKIRERYGLIVFRKFFEQIVQRCRDADLVWGKELYFDGSLVLANASGEGRVPRFYWRAMQQHLDALFPTSPAEKTTSASAAADLVNRYDGTIQVAKPNSYTRLADYWVNPVDPYATPSGQHTLGYRLHYVVDGGRSRIIMNCLVTPSVIQDNAPMLDLAWHTRFRWHLQPQIAVADTKYGTGENLAALEQNGIKAYIPTITQALSASDKKHFPKSVFTYRPETEDYLCPNGKILPYRTTEGQTRHYRAMPADCRACPLRAKCTTRSRGRTVSHSIYKKYEDLVASYVTTQAYQKALRKRQVWIEPRFGEFKQWHDGRRFRLRGIHKVNIETLVRASVQNIKELLKGKRLTFQPDPPILPVQVDLSHHIDLPPRYHSACLSKVA